MENPPESTSPEPLVNQLGLSREKIRRHSGIALGIGIGLIVVGLAAIALPGLFTLGFEVFIGWLLLLGGALQTGAAISALGSKGSGLALLAGILTAVVGVLFLLNPLKGAVALTLFLAVLFLVNGILRITYGLQTKGVAGSGLSIFNGVLGILLAVIVFAEWPSSAVWFLGLILGIEMLFIGMTLATFASAVRKEMSEGGAK